MKQRPVDDVAVADHPADVGAAPPDLARLDAVEVLHRPFQRDHMPAIVAHDALRLARRARGVEDIERIGREHRHAIGGFFRRHGAARAFGPVVIAPGDEFAACCGRCKMMQACGLTLDSLIASSSSGLYGTMRPGSSPQQAEKISFGLASSIRVASSLAAKPPNTTECTAPIRAQASIAITASGTIGI